MFYLLTIVSVAYNFCVEKTDGNCISKCTNLPNDVQTIDHLPNYNDISEYGTVNVYIADGVDYRTDTPFSQYESLVLCDDSIIFTYETPVTSLKVSSYIETNRGTVSNFPAKIQFNFEENLNLMLIDNHEDCTLDSIILKASSPNLFLFTNINSNINIQCQFSISDDSNIINVYDYNNQLKSIFSDSNKIQEVNKKYYCISDKAEKCSDYSINNPKVINSISEITGDSVVLIVESTTNQIYFDDFRKRYIKFIGLEGSHIIYNTYWQQSYNSGEFTVIINENDIQMSNSCFEGKGSFTLVVPGSITLDATTATNKFDFTLKTRSLYDNYNTEIYTPLNEAITFSNKIKVPDFHTFHGPEILTGLFDDGKYVPNVDIQYINTNTDLTIPEIDGLYYEFAEGTYEIPENWNKKSNFRSQNENSNVVLTFKNVHTLTSEVNNLISILWCKLEIHPLDILFLSLPENANIDFIVNGDLIVCNFYSQYNDGNKKSTKENINCNFKGSGKVKFLDPNYRNQIAEMCTIDDGVIFEDFTSQLLDYYVCVGQSSLDACKAKIENVNSIQDVTWIWAVRTDMISSLKNVKKIYITDNQIYQIDEEVDIILTQNAELTTFMDSITISRNKVNNIAALDSTAKLNVIFRGYHNEDEPYEYTKFKIICQEEPTDINLCIYFDEEIVKLFLNVPNTYTQKSIRLQGNTEVYVRNDQLNNIDIFDSPESIVFLENINTEYDSICYANDEEICKLYCGDYLHVTTIEEIMNYETSIEYLEVYIFKPVSFTMDMELNPAFYLFFYEGSSLTVEIPDKSRLVFGSSGSFCGFEVICGNSRSQMFYIMDKTVEVVFDIKNNVYLDIMEEDEIEEGSFLANIELVTTENNIEIIPCIDFSTKIHKINPEYKIKIGNDVSIKSPMPEYLESIFNSKTITFSGICVYLNEEGKALCGSKQSKSINEVRSQDINYKNVIITSGKDTTFSIPSSWTTEIMLFFIRTESSQINLIDCSTLSYYANGVQVNEKCIIVAGNIIINPPVEMIFNVDLPKGFPILSYMYFCFLDCGKNEQTNFYGGHLSGNQIFRAERCIHVGGYDSTHKLTVYFSKEDDLHEMYGVALLYGDDEGLNYKFGGYNYICYASGNDAPTKCTQPNYYLASDVSSLIKAIYSYPDLSIVVSKDLVIPESTGESLDLKAFDENIEITLPSPKSIQILENNCVQFNYDDSTTIKALNKMNIVVSINNNIELSVIGTLRSKIKFVLDANVIVSTTSKITNDFTIEVVKNDFHLYAEDVSLFGGIFGDSLEKYQKICAYAANSESLCTCDEKDTIENVFKSSINYQEIEIAISSNINEITLPLVSSHILINIKSGQNANLVVNSVSNTQIMYEHIILNNYWIFIENRDKVSVKLNKESTLLITAAEMAPFTFYLTDEDSVIDLQNCNFHENKKLTFVKYGENENILTISGGDQDFNNFKSMLVSFEGITIKQSDKQKYLCICKDESCNKCQNGIDGIIINSDSFVSDPGKNVEIRIFSNVEVASDLFTNEHNVVIDSSNTLKINNVENVYQNIENKLKIDNLIFSNGNNIIIKPKPSKLSITMAKQNAGPEFTIEMTIYLVLNVLNANEEGIVASKIKVIGNGELNLYDYPSDKVEAESTIKVIKGIYIICNSKAEGSFCSYKTLDNYRVINQYDDFESAFDKDSKILVILDTYTSRIDVNINRLQYQQIVFIKQGSSLNYLENIGKVRILSTTVLTNKADSIMNLDGSKGGVILSNDDSDSFIVGFDDQLTIKQEGNIESQLKPIVLQPQNEKAVIVIDNNVKIENQKIKIQTEKENLELTVYVGDKTTKDENINKFIDISDNKDKIKLVIKEGKPKEEEENKGLNTGQIIGIVIGVVAFVAIVIIVVIVIIKKKKKNDFSSTNEVSDQV